MADSPLQTTALHNILDRMRAGDAAAADELLRRACGRLERLARKMLRSFPVVRGWVETDDVLQNALLRLMKSLQAVRPASTREFFGLAAQQVRRELLDLARHFRGRAANQAPDSPHDSQAALDPPDQAPSADELERWCCFHREVEKLPTEERETVGLIFYHGCKQAEAAELLQVTDRTIRRWWESALVKLRVVLQQEPTRE